MSNYTGVAANQQPSLEEQIRQIVREEIAAQKERLFAEAKEYNTRTTLAAIEAYEKSLSDTP